MVGPFLGFLGGGISGAGSTTQADRPATQAWGRGTRCRPAAMLLMVVVITVLLVVAVVEVLVVLVVVVVVVVVRSAACVKG